MSFSLFKKNIKGSIVILSTMIIVFLFYFVIMMSMYDPENLAALDSMMEYMPQALIDMMGFDSYGTTLFTFLAGYMYRFLVFLFPMVLSIVINHRLVAAHVESGSMTYILASPNNRRKIIETQIISGIFMISMFFIIYTIVTLIIATIMFPGELDISRYLLINFYALIMYYAIGGIGFLASTIANDSKKSLTFGVGIPVAFLVLQMLGRNEQVSFFGNFSLFSLFDSNKIGSNNGFVGIAIIIMLLIGSCLYGASIIIFNKKNMYV